MTDPMQQFIQEAREDPYTSMLVHVWIDAFASGYEAAVKEVAPMIKPSREEMLRKGTDELLSIRSRLDVSMIAALATLGRNHPNLVK